MEDKARSHVRNQLNQLSACLFVMCNHISAFHVTDIVPSYVSKQWHPLALPISAGAEDRVAGESAERLLSQARSALAISLSSRTSPTPRRVPSSVRPSSQFPSFISSLTTLSRRYCRGADFNKGFRDWRFCILLWLRLTPSHTLPASPLLTSLCSEGDVETLHECQSWGGGRAMASVPKCILQREGGGAWPRFFSARSPNTKAP